LSLKIGGNVGDRARAKYIIKENLPYAVIKKIHFICMLEASVLIGQQL
jgi:hypothetical protein